MVFTINKNLVFIDSMQSMNSSLDSLVKNLPDNDFKYLSEEIDVSFLVLQKINVQAKRIIHMLLVFGMCLK